ncbi:MAG: response regulator [Ignavibacteria bacterium]|nr:response regulator [Ignavibacteria bacterium]
MSREKILIVEDDLFTARLISKMLTNRDFAITDIITKSSEVINSIEKNTPDIILMDITLEGELDGIEIAQKIAEKYSIPIIYLTADSSDETIKRAKITGPFGYLIKPINEKILIATIEITLQKQYLHNKEILETLKKANDELEEKVKQRTAELVKKNIRLQKEIKQRKLAEEELKKSERLATIGKMAAILAHEIRNPLNSIKINTDVLSCINDLNETNKKRIQIIQTEINRLENLVKEVLQFSKNITLYKNEFNLTNFVDQVIHQIQPDCLVKGIMIMNNTDNVIINADMEKLKQVFLNMFYNSIDAMTENGVIEVYTDVLKSKIKIFIKDNGYGVEYPDRIFEPFFTTKEKGTGIGLALSQNIIEHHNGKLELVSTRPGETIFCITLPLNKKIKNEKNSNN